MDPVTAVKTAQIIAALARSRTVRWLVAGIVLLQALVLIAALLAPTAVISGMAGQRQRQQQLITDDRSCPTGLGETTGPVSMPGLSAEQMSNARTIWQTGIRLGVGQQGTVVGIATAMQEATLRNLDHGDRDSLGLFQQRASWGTAAVRMNPARSAELFYTALKEVDGWKTMPLTVAAQTVQRSAFPDAYAKHERLATGLAALFAASETTDGQVDPAEAQGWLNAGLCTPPGSTDAATCPATGSPAEDGLTPDALRVMRCLTQQWPQLDDWAGIGDRPANVDRDHQEGRAVDAMIPGYRTATGRQLGGEVADWVVRNRDRLGVTYVIWDARIWSVQRAEEGWRDCGTPAASCYAGPDDTTAHRDHVHISVNGNTAGTNTAVTGTHAAGKVVRPVESYVLTARFGSCGSRWAACHTGLDFAAATGTELRAVTDGTVTFVSPGGDYGLLTKISHGDGIESWYAHQLAAGVTVGQDVTAGQPVGRLGASGNVTGPHLHLEIRERGTPIDPAGWLTARGARP